MKRLTSIAFLVAFHLQFVTQANAENLQDLYRFTGNTFGAHTAWHEIKLPKGTESVLAEINGPGKVTYWYITDDSDGKWYPGLVLKVFWDDEPQPSILVPLADFFGAIAGKSIDYQSAPMMVNHLCYACQLPMPFSRRARFILANDGESDYARAIAYGIDYEQGAEFARERSRLHATWRRSNPTEKAVHTILAAKGRGHYVGNFLQVHTQFKGWWGEGDTIFHIDGKTITHTPGTEDEYGSCFGFGSLYAFPSLGHIQDDHGDNRMYRWYLTDPVRFSKSLTIEIQNQHAEGAYSFDQQVLAADDYTSVAFWYQTEPHQSISLPSFAERTAPSRAAAHK